MKRLFLFLLITCRFVFCAAPESFDPTRPFFKRLNDVDRVRETEKEMPFLVVQTAHAYELDPQIVFNRVKKYLEKSKLDIKGRFTKEVFPPLTKRDQFNIPEISITGKELEGIKECTKQYCAVKLALKTEVPRMESGEDKLATYGQLIFERLVAYFRAGDIRGYDERVSNIDTLKEGMAKLPFFASRYPKVKAFLDSSLLSRSLPHDKPEWKSGFVRMEMVNMQGDKMKPVLRFSEAIEFEENGAHLFFEPHIYTNHFFDSSFRLIEVIPFTDPKRKSLLVVTDVMEIDELKKSGLIRALFTGKMSSGVQEHQSQEIDAIQKVAP